MVQKNVLRCLVPLLGLTLLGVLAALYVVDFKDYHRVLATLFGFNTNPDPFFDWDYIRAGIKCWNEGINVYVTNPCDLMNRPHGYSPLWLRAVFIPTDKAWTMPIGLGIVLAYLLSLFWLIKPANWRELIVLALACISPMAVYCLERGNADAVIFIMLVIAGVLGAGPPANRLLSYSLILLAGLLKFYPLVALSTVLREHLEQTSIALIAPARCFRAAPLRSAAKLLLADEGERSAEPFVLDNRALVNLLDCIEGPVGKFDALVADRQATVGIIDDGDPLADCRLRLFARLQDEQDLVVLQRQRL